VTINLNAAMPSTAYEPIIYTPPNDTITIGLLVDNLQNGQQAIIAAQLAIKQTNLIIGKSGNFFKLAIRETDGPWGQASNKTAELIYDEKVVAIVGVLNGRTAHLAEQVTAKSQITYIETLATDPTLSKAFVPWFFRVVPNDYQVSMALAKDIYERSMFSRVAIISDSSYDGKMASSTLKKVISGKNLKNPTCFLLNDQRADFAKIIPQLMEEKYQAIVLVTNTASQNPALMSFLEESTAQIYHMREQLTSYGYPAYTVSVVANLSKYEKFDMQFQNLTNSNPSAQSIYVYDAVSLLLGAITSVGSNPNLIGQQTGEMDVYDGISGQIEFDKYGNLVRSIEFTIK
jgi:ABC-type branched-subunit amino acid transport system substrate-binding protein